MAELQKSDVVRSLGNVLTEIDVLMASPDLSDSDFKEVRKLRRELDRVQGNIVAEAFRENTRKFQEAAERLEKVNADVEETISDVEQVAVTIGSVSTLISAAEKVLPIAIV